jgi:hypothetical protein
MQVKYFALSIIFMVGLLVGAFAVPGIAAQDVAAEPALPREFQGVRLGMALSDLVTIVPDANRVSLGRHDQKQQTVLVSSKNRHLQRIEYRFYNDRLREMAIHYNPDKETGGYQRLLERLRESYGTPIVADQREQSNLGSHVIMIKKTIWKDRATISSLAESHKIIDDQRELILTITDLELQQAFEQDQEHRRRQRELSVPVPLVNNPVQNRQATISHSENARNVHAGG